MQERGRGSPARSGSDVLPFLGPVRSGKLGFSREGEPLRILAGGYISKRRVRPEMIVILPPAFDLLARIVQRQKPVRVQALVPEAAVE